MKKSNLKFGIKLFYLLIFSGVISACSTLKTQTYLAQGADLSSYQTYAWINLKHYLGENEENKRRYAQFILEHADAKIKEKGYVLDTINPQVVFQFDTKIEHRVAYHQTPTVSVGMGFGGPGYYVGGAVPVAGGNVVQNEFDQGILKIELLDTQSGRLLWRGTAEEKIGFETDLEADLNQAINTIFTKFQVKKKK